MECPECGYGYAPYDARDRKRHRDYHDGILLGVPAPLIDSRYIIWEGEQPPLFILDDEDLLQPQEDTSGHFIIVLTPRSPLKLRKVAWRVAMFANRETRFDFGVYHWGEQPDPKRDRHVFLYKKDGRFVGLVLFDLRRSRGELSWDLYARFPCSPLTPNLGPFRAPYKNAEPFWSVSYAWVHRNHRREGIGTRLISVAANYLGAQPDQLGVSPPLTDDGEQFARSMFRDKVRLAR